MANLFQPSLVRATDSSGNPISGAKLYFYLTGTTTPATWYTDQAGAVPGVNPLTADSVGLFAPAFMDPATTYRMVLKTFDGATTIYDVDPVRGFDESQLSTAASDAVTASAQAVTAQEGAEDAEAGAVEAQTAAEIARADAVQAALGASYYPGARSYVPRGMTSVAITAAGTGGTNGDYTCPLTGDNLSVDAYATVTVAGGVVTVVAVSAPGLYIGASPTAGTVDTSSITGLTGATLTPTIGYLRTSGQYYITDHASDSFKAALFQNQANAAVEVDASVDWLDISVAREAQALTEIIVTSDTIVGGSLFNVGDDDERLILNVRQSGETEIRKLIDGDGTDIFARLTTAYDTSATALATALAGGASDNKRAYLAARAGARWPGTMATAAAPSLVVSGSGAATSISGGSEINYANAAFRYLHATPFQDAPNAWARFESVDNGLAARESCGVAVEFDFTGQQVEFVTICAGARFRVQIDGDFASATYQTLPNDGSVRRILVTMPATGSHTLKLEGSIGFKMRGVVRESGKAITAPSTAAPFRVAAFGDSWGEGSSGAGMANPCRSVTMVAGVRQNWSVLNSSSGGTGMLRPGTAPRKNYRDRLADATSLSDVDMVWAFISQNDTYGGIAAGSVGTNYADGTALAAGLAGATDGTICNVAATTFYQKRASAWVSLGTVQATAILSAFEYQTDNFILDVRAWDATVPILFTGPASPQTLSNGAQASNTYYQLAEIVKKLCVRHGCLYNDRMGIVIGTGMASSPASNGNADFLIGGTAGSDNAHPYVGTGGSDGADYIGGEIAARLDTLLHAELP